MKFFWNKDKKKDIGTKHSIDPFENIDTSLLEKSNEELELATSQLKEHAGNVVHQIRRESSESLLYQIYSFSMQLTDAVIVGDENGVITHINNAAEGLFRYSVNELKGKNVNILLPSEMAERHDAAIADYHANGPSVVNSPFTGVRETSIKTKDGNIVPVELSISSFVTPLGEEYFAAIIRDIEERVEYEVKLKKSEAMFRVVIEQSYDGMFIIEDERFIVVNTAFCNILGFDMDELVGMHYLQQVHEDYKHTIMFNHNARKDGDTSLPETYVLKATHKNGSIVYLQLSPRVVDATSGVDKKWIIGTVRDVTKEYIRDKARDEQIDYFKTLFESGVLGVLILNEDGIIRDVNKMACCIYEYYPHELIGESFLKLVPDDKIAEAPSAFRTAFQTNYHKSKYWTNKTKTGNLVDLIASGSNVTLSNGDVVRVITLINASEVKEKLVGN